MPLGQQFTYTVRAPGRLPSAEEFGQIIVRAKAGEGILRLKDVARVKLGAQNYSMIGRLNGKPAALWPSTRLQGQTRLQPLPEYVR